MQNGGGDDADEEQPDVDEAEELRDLREREIERGASEYPLWLLPRPSCLINVAPVL